MSDEVQQPSTGTAIVPHTFDELEKYEIQDPVESLLGKMDDLSDDDKIGILGFADEYEGSIFELRCALFSSFVTEKHLKAFITAYNSEAPNKCWQTISLDHAYDLAKVGRLLREAGKRVPTHFPLVPQSFFVIALRAGDKFFDALSYAEERFEDSARDPENHPALTARAFREDVLPKTEPEETPPVGNVPDSEEDSGSESDTPKPEESKTEPALNDAPVSPASEPEEDDAPLRKEFKQILKKGDDQIEFRMTFDGDRIFDVDFEVLARPELVPGESIQYLEPLIELTEEEKLAQNCFSCKGCQAIGEGQRLALVNVDASGLPDREEPIAGVFESSPVWFCAPRRFVIGVRSQGPVFERSVALARGCPKFVRLEEPSPEEPSGERHETNLSVDDLSERLGIVS